MSLRSGIRRFLCLICGLVLVPVCVASTLAVSSLLLSVQPASYSMVPSTAVALLSGFVLWVTIYFVLPRPIRTYVLAHELTHALWAYLTGGTVSRMRLSSTGGSVVVSKNNVLITLAPYFFPLYTMIVIVIYFILSIFVNVNRYELLWLGLVGFTWGFHITFTVSTLLEHQSDIAEYGHVLSYAVIYLLNALGIGLWIVAVSSAALEQFVNLLSTNLGGIWRSIGKATGVI